MQVTGISTAAIGSSSKISVVPSKIKSTYSCLLPFFGNNCYSFPDDANKILEQLKSASDDEELEFHKSTEDEEE